jgi:hypothetical protein
VGHAAGKGAKALQALGAQKLHFELFFLSDVGIDEED